MKIMIVDDEVIIRTGLCTVIDWKELGLELIPPASSAEEALERIPEEKPHILLTDIRMSGKDGIELAREVKALLPDTEIVILTGYDDFAYAQQALREGVTDYLLKTSRPEEIIKAAMKAKQNILDKWELLKQENLQQGALRSQLLEKLLTKGLQGDDSTFERIQEWFLKNKVQEDVASPSPMQVMLLSASGWGDDRYTSLLQGAVDNILYELLPSVTLLQKDRIILVMHTEVGLIDQSKLQKALQRVQQTLKCKVFAALGCIVTDYEGLKSSYLEAEQVFSFKGVFGSEGLFTVDDVKDRSGGRNVCSQKDESELASILVSNNTMELRHWVNMRVRTQMEDPNVTPATLQGFLQSMVISGHRWLERVRSGQGEPERGEKLPAVYGFELDGRPEDEVFKLLSSVMSVFHQSMADNRFSYIRKSIAYIKENLDQNLTLQQVAGFVHLNPNHFSEVFKRETGYNYIEFVTQERMRLASEILLESQVKISDVAKRVGYEDIKYFSQQFKKHKGQTPSEYRLSAKD